MGASIERLAVHMEVGTQDHKSIGQIVRIWWPDGRVEPPEPEPQGLLVIQEADRVAEGDEGYFQVNRFLAPAWYIPFSAVAGVTGGRVLLNVAEREAERLPWQERPGRRL